MGCNQSKSAEATAATTKSSPSAGERDRTTKKDDARPPSAKAAAASQAAQRNDDDRKSGPVCVDDAFDDTEAASLDNAQSSRPGLQEAESAISSYSNVSVDLGQALHDLLLNACTPAAERPDSPISAASGSSDGEPEPNLWFQVATVCKSSPEAASYQDGATHRTILHLACILIDVDEDSHPDGEVKPKKTKTVAEAVSAIVKSSPDSASKLDADGNLPLHYAISPFASKIVEKGDPAFDNNTWAVQMPPPSNWDQRAQIIQTLTLADPRSSTAYLSRNDVRYNHVTVPTLRMSRGCTPLYRSVQLLPDDFVQINAPTVEFVRSLLDAVVLEGAPDMTAVKNMGDGDKPLALLYRRFLRQFDLAEKFFEGDNSRREVVEHRRDYKVAAGNTFNIIRMLLRPKLQDGVVEEESEFRIVHGAVQTETPPDLLRYILETNPDEISTLDERGNLPLHYAARATAPLAGGENAPTAKVFPAYYSKYVIDELLYKYPDGASVKDGCGKYPLALAVESGKKWIGGGVKSLYEVYPDAEEQIDTRRHPTIGKAISFTEAERAELEAAEEGDMGEEEEGKVSGIVADEHHDAIMLVQRADADLADVCSAMWANEEDGGVQMLGCLAITRMAELAVATWRDDGSRGGDGGGYDLILQIAMAAVSTIVNAMKSHPNEVIVQEKACAALRALSYADGRGEVSFVATGAVGAAVGAMQSHVGDAIVQEEACGAIANVVSHGGGQDRATVVASVSGLTAIVNALGAHPDEAGVQREACRALDVLTGFPDANIPILPKEQTAPLLKAARSKFPEECREHADAVLSRLS